VEVRMTIHTKQLVTLAEVKEIVDKLEDSEKSEEMKSYLKKFTKLSKKDAAKLKEELSALDNVKVREENVIKLVDIVPKDAEEVSKIFSDTGVTEEETNAILEITKKY
jgi:DNA-directed RNA polymerase subunit F